MAGSTLCVFCASLPVKDASAAARRQPCPECKADIGVTSYGTCFRLPQAKRKKWLLAPTFFQGVAVGAGIFMFVLLVVAMQFYIQEQTPTTRVAELKNTPIPAELTGIPEIGLDNPISHKLEPGEGKQRLLGLIAQIKAENGGENKDAFLIRRIRERKELRGLPFVMGDACRMPADRAKVFQESVSAVRDAIDPTPVTNRQPRSTEEHHVTFWNSYLAAKGHEGLHSEAGIAALTQILGPETQNMRHSYVKQLTNVNRCEATKMLARAAIFDPSGEVRNAALKALKERPKGEYTEILMHGIRYPIPVVAKRAGVAMVMLDRKDMLPQLVEFLGETAPGDPCDTVVEGQNVCTVREVVRINHHRNCLLCHAPAQTGNPEEVPGLIPSPGTPFAPLSREYYGTAVTRGEPVVRADTTYLRQDFSVMMPVADAAPWPEMQRFDFLVRTRVVEGNELAALRERVQQRGAARLSENHQAALQALRELTGQDAAPTRAAWQQVLGMNAAK